MVTVVVHNTNVSACPVYTKTGLVFWLPENQILVELSPDWKTPRTFPGQKAPTTLLGQNSFRLFSENYFVMGIKENLRILAPIHL